MKFFENSLKYIGHLIVFYIFGLYPFLLINAIFAELGVFINTQPEGKSIGANIGLAFQLGNAVVVTILTTFIALVVNPSNNSSSEPTTPDRKAQLILEESSDPEELDFLSNEHFNNNNDNNNNNDIDSMPVIQTPSKPFSKWRSVKKSLSLWRNKYLSSSNVNFDAWILAVLSILGIINFGLVTGIHGTTASDRSIGLYVCSFLGGFVGCGSVIVLYAFVGKFSYDAIIATSLGNASSAAITGILSSIQDGETDKLSVEAFFLIIAVFPVLSFLMFIFIIFRFSSYWNKTQYDNNDHHTIENDDNNNNYNYNYNTGDSFDNIISEQEGVENGNEKDLLLSSYSHPSNNNNTNNNNNNNNYKMNRNINSLNASTEESSQIIFSSSDLSKKPRKDWRSEWEIRIGDQRGVTRKSFILLILMFSELITFFVIPGIEPYLLQGKSKLNVDLGNSFLIGGCIGRITTFISSVPNIRNFHRRRVLLILGSMFITEIILGIYLIVDAIWNASPFFKSIPWFTIMALGSFSFLNAYINTISFREIQETYGSNLSRYAGIVHQIGAGTGTFLAFGLVSWTSLFH